MTFTQVRAEIEQFLLQHRGFSEALRRLGSGGRSRPRIISLYKKLIADFEKGKTQSQVYNSLRRSHELGFFVTEPTEIVAIGGSGKFNRDTKGAAYLRDALPSTPKCPTCGGLLHRNGMQTGHRKARREGGPATVANAQMQHPFCNSTMDRITSKHVARAG